MSPQPPRRPDDDPSIAKPKDDEDLKAKEIEKVKPDKEQPEKLKQEKLEVKEIEKVKSDKEFEKFRPEKEFEKVKSDKEFETKVKSDKEFEKVKPEKEGKLETKEIEKIKRDDEKLPEKLKREKEGKLEFEKLNVEKPPFEKLNIEKPDKENVEGPPTELRIDPAAGLDTNELLRHAESLEESGRQLRHFIERSQRPDLSEGALRNEADLQDDPDEGGEDA